MKKWLYVPCVVICFSANSPLFCANEEAQEEVVELSSAPQAERQVAFETSKHKVEVVASRKGPESFREWKEKWKAQGLTMSESDEQQQRVWEEVQKQLQLKSGQENTGVTLEINWIDKEAQTD